MSTRLPDIDIREIRRNVSAAFTGAKEKVDSITNMHTGNAVTEDMRKSFSEIKQNSKSLLRKALELSEKSQSFVTPKIERLVDDLQLASGRLVENLKEQSDQLVETAVFQESEVLSFMNDAVELTALPAYDLLLGTVKSGMELTDGSTDAIKNISEGDFEGARADYKDGVDRSLLSFQLGRDLAVEDFRRTTNSFSDPDKWRTTDYLIYKRGELLGCTGKNSYLAPKKDAWVEKYWKDIQSSADKYSLPPELLAGVAWSEFGGQPDILDSRVYSTRIMFPEAQNSLSQLSGALRRLSGRLEETSFGTIQMQIGTATDTIWKPSSVCLSEFERQSLISSLKDPLVNFDLAARHLADLREKDFSKSSHGLTEDEMLVVVATRYNRGPSLSLEEIQQDLEYGEIAIEEGLSFETVRYVLILLFRVTYHEWHSSMNKCCRCCK